jgi:agmatine deiminase
VNETPRDLGFRMPAEWEPHAATWLAWPHNETDWPKKGLLVEWVFVEMARLLSRGERVRFLVRNARDRKRARIMLKRSGVDLGKIDFVTQPTDRSWARDFVPQFVVRGNEKSREVAAVAFEFDGWGRYSESRLDDAAGDSIAQRFAPAIWQPSVKRKKRERRFVLEGGALDADGAGSLLVTEQCLLDSQYSRNRGLSRADNEKIFHDYLGVTNVIWLEDGIAGDDTSGHVDDFVRFVAKGRVVLAQEPNAKDANHRPLRRAYERLKQHRVDIVTLPMPSPVVFAKQRLPASYANFYIGNEVVIVPTFNDPKDREALGILAELFPTRDVVGVYARDLVLGLGTLHCSSHEEPAGKRARLGKATRAE